MLNLTFDVILDNSHVMSFNLKYCMTLTYEKLLTVNYVSAVSYAKMLTASAEPFLHHSSEDCMDTMRMS